VHEIGAVRAVGGSALRVLAPGIRLAGDSADDQARIATPALAARRGADYVVLGRTVTAASEPAEALQRVLAELAGSAAGIGGVAS
jgi:orotidine-5'-phosphate decarboxylase